VSGAEIQIGDDTGMSGTTVCAMTSVIIGRGCLIGADVMIVDTDFHPIAPEGRRYSAEGVTSAPVRIGDNVFIGARTIVLKGVTIGDNTVIGAGSVVTKNLPANVVAAGNPARVLGPLPAERSGVGGPSAC
jgi:acetyltransferase-like isoleucine patch superfamily enzyme